jgi:hypothetical protein
MLLPPASYTASDTSASCCALDSAARVCPSVERQCYRSQVQVRIMLASTYAHEILTSTGSHIDKSRASQHSSQLDHAPSLLLENQSLWKTVATSSCMDSSLSATRCSTAMHASVA